MSHKFPVVRAWVGRYWQFVASAVMVWAMLGMFALILVAGVLGADSLWTYLTAAVFVGPFVVVAFVGLSVAWGHFLVEEYREARK